MSAFGKLLSNPTDWKNQQYITMNGVRDGGDAARRFARLKARG